MIEFQTARLIVQDWSATIADPVARLTLEADLTNMLSPAVLAHLPDPMRFEPGGDVTDWLDARTAECEGLLVRAEGHLVGLVLLARPGDGTCHVGYLLAQDRWGQGIGSELLCGLVAALHADAPIRLLGGVANDNPASARVLTKAGFQRDLALSSDDTDMFVLEID